MDDNIGTRVLFRLIARTAVLGGVKLFALVVVAFFGVGFGSLAYGKDTIIPQTDPTADPTLTSKVASKPRLAAKDKAAAPRKLAVAKDRLAKDRLAKDRLAKDKLAKDKHTPEPWASVDPARVAADPASQGAARDSAAAAKPFRIEEDPVTYGMKWNSSNAPAPGTATTGSLVNQYNHTLGAPAASGTDAEVGVKFKF